MTQGIDIMVSKYYWWVIFILLGAALFSHLDYLPLNFEEPRRGTVALEMELSGNYLTPTINGEYYYNKPPIYNWFLVVLFKIFGHEDWVLRLPTVISFLLLGWVNYRLMRKKLGEKVAVLSSLFLITSSDLLFYFSFQGEIDMFYSLIVYLQIISIIWFFDTKNYQALFLISYFLAAVGILTKGLPSIAFQGITLLAFFIYHKRYGQLFNLWHFAGLGLFVGIVGCYFWMYGLSGDAVPFMARLLTESSSRTVAEASFMNSIGHLFSFPLVLIDVFSPWLILTPLFLSKTIYEKIKESKWLGYVLLFFVPNLMLYWISPGTRDRYLYMFIPFATLVFAFVIHQSISTKARLSNLSNYVMIGLIGLFAVAMIALPFVHPVSTIPSITAICAVLFLLFSICLWCFYQSETNKLSLFILFIVVIRIGFNFIVLPLRLEEELVDDYELHVDNMLEIVGEKPLYFQGKKETSTRQLPFSSATVEYNELIHYPFHITYHFEKKRKKIFEYSDAQRVGDFYFSQKKHYESLSGEKKIVYEFHSVRRDENFVLYQFL